MMLHVPERPWLLLVEDSPADVYLVQEAIRHEGLAFDWKIAEDGETAIQLIDFLDADGQTPAPKLLLLDINVPRRTGNDVLRHCRASLSCSSVPVLMISSSDSAAERQRAHDQGATEYFRKPSSLDDFMLLGGVVRRILETPRKTARGASS